MTKTSETSETSRKSQMTRTSERPQATGWRPARWLARGAAVGSLVASVVAVWAWAAGGCGGIVCSGWLVPSVRVWVDDADGHHVGHEVARVDLETPEGWELCLDDSDVRSWQCGFEQAGTVRVRRVAAGLEPEIREVHVSEDECHVHTQKITFTLPAGYTPPVPTSGATGEPDAGATDTTSGDVSSGDAG